MAFFVVVAIAQHTLLLLYFVRNCGPWVSIVVLAEPRLGLNFPPMSCLDLMASLVKVHGIYSHRYASFFLASLNGSDKHFILCGAEGAFVVVRESLYMRQRFCIYNEMNLAGFTLCCSLELICF